MNSTERRIAVVIEDDADIRQLLATVLEQAGFETILTGNGVDGVNAVREHNPLITTLDVSMPGIDGFETAKRIRAFSSTYLIMLTARAEEIDTLQGLEAGADDYVTKPFRPRELRARIEAMLRRPRADSTAATGPGAVDGSLVADAAEQLGEARELSAPAAAPTVVGNEQTRDDWREHRGLRLSSAERRVQLAGEEIDLTRTEFNLLEVLLSSGRRVRSKSELAELLRSEDAAFYVSDADKRAIEVHLANLRRKLGDHPTTPRWIETVRGVGYRLTAQDASS
ncbi:MAG: response regulator transcription factor [Leifsonia sp.]